MSLGIRWTQTEEFLRAELRTFMYHEDLVLPAKEFEFFKPFLLRRIGTMLRVYVNKPMLNNPMARFLWALWERLDIGQRGEILLADKDNVIQAWRENVSCHPAELSVMTDKHNWLGYWSLQNYLLYVRGIGSFDGVNLLDHKVVSAIYEEYRTDPRYAYRNNCAIQWTGDNQADINRYYGNNFDVKPMSGGRLEIVTCNGPLVLNLGDWTYPDTADGIDGGDYKQLIQRKLVSDLGIWIKPGSTPLAPSI